MSLATPTHTSTVYTLPTPTQRVARQLAHVSDVLCFTPGVKALEWLFTGMGAGPDKGYGPLRQQGRQAMYLAMSVAAIPLAIPATIIGSIGYYLGTKFAHRIHLRPAIKSPAHPHNPESLKVMTYNAALTHSFVCVLTNIAPARKRWQAIAEKILEDRPHVLLLQECLSKKAPLAKALALGGYHVFEDVALNPVGSESGLMLASQFPVESGEFFHIGHYLGVDKWATRGLFEAKLRLPDGQKMAVYNLHLQSGGEDPRAVAARAAQVEAVFSIVKKRFEEDKELAFSIVGGDFNVAEFSEEGGPSASFEETPMDKQAPFVNALYQFKDKNEKPPGTFWRLDNSKQVYEGYNPDHLLLLSRKDTPLEIDHCKVRYDYGHRSDHVPLELAIKLEK